MLEVYIKNKKTINLFKSKRKVKKYFTSIHVYK